MAIAIRMPPILRPQVGGQRSVEVAGATLGEALRRNKAEVLVVR